MADDTSGFPWGSPELLRCPYPHYERLRRESRVWEDTLTRDFVIGGWHDIVDVAEAPEMFGSSETWSVDLGFSPRAMAASDGAEHRLKKAAARDLFGTANVRAFDSDLRALSHDLIDRWVASGRVAFGREYARVFPIGALARVLGFSPAVTTSLIERVTERTADPSRLLSSRQVRASRDRDAELRECLQYEVLARCREPEDDLLTRWIGRVSEHGWDALDYLATELGFLFFAGARTVTHLLMTAMLFIATDRARREELWADTSGVPGVVEEALRIDAPIQWLQRTVRADAVVADARLPRAASVVLLWGSGNRDERRFDWPDEFDPNRRHLAGSHLAFGRGVHYCLGAPLARLEGRIALETLIERVENIRLDAPCTSSSPARARTPQELIVRFDAR